MRLHHPNTLVRVIRHIVAGALLVPAMWCWLGPAGASDVEIRTAKVAGRFYPGDPADLLDLVSGLLEEAPASSLPAKPRILLVPHAGYPYSGSIAAEGFGQLQGQTYDGVVVVGFTHRMQFDGSSVDTREAYETPLGLLPVDQEAVAVLLTQPGIVHVEAAHESDEHSLEVELPFLQAALGRARIVPILMGSIQLAHAEQLAKALARLSRFGDYLYVFSTDLSHYHPYEEAQTLDELTVNAIAFETAHAVHRLFSRGEIEACGRGPIVTSLFLSQALGYLKPMLLSYANSGDTAGNPASVVGYAAMAMVDRQRPHVEAPLSAEAGSALVRAARQSLQRTLAKRDVNPSDTLKSYPELSQARGAFVTLRKDGALRGCIGRIQTSEPLARTIPVVAVEAALHDSRFQPVSAEELDEVHVEVSVLTQPTKLNDLSELVPGQDGVILEHQGHSGVFLPQVWHETGWTRMEFLRELASQKAGLPPDAWQHAHLSIFQDHAFEEPHP